MDNKRLGRVLIIKPSSLGDVIHALPVAAALKAADPSVMVDWVVSGGYAGLLSGNPDIDRVILFDRGMFKGPGGLSRLSSFVKELRRERYDIVLDLQGLLRSGLMAFATRSGLRAGFANAREGAPLFYNRRVPVPDLDVHAVDRYMSALDAVGVAHGEPVFRLPANASDEGATDAILSDAGIGNRARFVAMAPSARWDTKRWPAAMFAELAGRLFADEGIRSVFVGTASDAELMKGIDAGPDNGIYQAFGRTTVSALGTLFARAALVVTNDSGPMHIAAAAGVPTLAIFGPTDPKRTGPYGKTSRTLTPADECAPCFSRNCDNVRCLAGISVDRVHAEAVSMLKEEVCP